MERQAHNVFRMRMLGAEVVPVTTGSRTLKDATSEAMRHWVTDADDTHYCSARSSARTPIRRWFASSSGSSATRPGSSARPSSPPACPTTWSPASAAAPTRRARSPASSTPPPGWSGSRPRAARGDPRQAGVLHGFRSLFLQDEDGQITEAHSIAAGLDYPGVGPEHAHLRDLGRARYVTVTDDEAPARCRLARTEGILPALESAHALAWVIRAADAGEMPAGRPS